MKKITSRWIDTLAWISLIFAYVMLLPFMLIVKEIYFNNTIHNALFDIDISGNLVVIGFIFFFVIISIGASLQTGKMYVLFKREKTLSNVAKEW